jgi:hypothetical protein
METQTLKTVQFGKYKAVILSRSNSFDGTKYPYSVKFVQETPKGKYSTEKIVEHIKYATFERAEQQAQAYVDARKANIERKEQQRIAKKEANKNVDAKEFYKEGDVIVNTWGYEQTNVNYYKVYKVTAKTISVIEISQKMVENSLYSHGMACEVMPDVENLANNPANYNLRVYENGRLSNPESFYYMKKWSGNAQYNSWYY